MQWQNPTVWCHRGVLNGESVQLLRRVDGSSARLSGVTTCKKPWSCPVCCIRIAQRRAAELREAVERWTKAGGLVYLVTYTFPHESDHALAPMLDLFYDARQRFANCRAFKNIRDAHQSPGVVRSTEVTVGRANGWHPHLHELLFVRGKLTDDERLQLRSNWVRLLLKVGLGDPSKLTDMMEHALDIRGGQKAADYLAKFGREETWGLSSELTIRHAKVGKADGDTMKPFALLGLSADGDEWARARFVEYVDAFAKRRLITWTQTLRKELGMGEEVPDAELPEEELVPETAAADLTLEQFSVVNSRRAMGQLLELVALCCWAADAQAIVDDFVAGLGRVRARGRGDTMVPMAFPRGKNRHSIAFGDMQ